MNYFENIYQRYMDEANKYAFKFGLDPRTNHNGEWDAFRHAYASGEMTREYSEEISRVFDDLNEVRGDLLNKQPDNERNMDLWNNAVGRDIGGNASSKEEVAQGAYEALQRGDLITDPERDERRYAVETPNPNGPFPEDPWHGADPDAWGDAFDGAERTVSPIVLDLNGDGVKTTALTQGAWGGTHFNLDAQGKQHHQLGCLHPANTQPWRQTA